MNVLLQERERIKISSYNDSSGEKILLGSSMKEPSPNLDINFSRQGDNHAYTKGEVSYKGECRNNLVISFYQKTELLDIENAFVLLTGSSAEISPILDINYAIYNGKKELFGKKINYLIPRSVFNRENLREKNFNRLDKEIKKQYDVHPRRICVINSGRTKNGIYYIEGKDNKKYVLKFRGFNKLKSELLSEIAEGIPDYFPTNFRKKRGHNFNFMMEDEFYGLEEFIEGISPGERGQEYFRLLGKHIGLLHNHLQNFLKKHPFIKRVFAPSGNAINESNLISLYLDLIADEKNRPLLSFLEDIIKEDLPNQIMFSPKILIQGDLNYSNLIWQGSNPKIVDCETIKISRRLGEFESPLLFEGNMESPIYVKNSLEAIVNAYNQSSEIPLVDKEMETFGSLLIYRLLKNFVVRHIRRGKNGDYLNKTLKNIDLLKRDLR